jgi:shikimate kinase
MAADPTTRERRPNLTVDGGRREIEALLAIREPLYRETATLTVDVDDRSIDEIVSQIVPALAANNPPASSAAQDTSGSKRS